MTTTPSSHPPGRAPVGRSPQPARADFYIDEQTDPFVILSTLAGIAPQLRRFFEQPKWPRLLLDDAMRAAFFEEIAIAADLLVQLTTIADEARAEAAELDRYHRHLMNEIRATRERVAVLGLSS